MVNPPNDPYGWAPQAREIAAMKACNQAFQEAQRRTQEGLYRNQLLSQGTGRQPAYQLLSANHTNGLAIAAFISSFFVSVLAVIFGHIALNQIKHTGESGRGLAIAALAIGYSEIILGLILTVILVSISSVYVR